MQHTATLLFSGSERQADLRILDLAGRVVREEKDVLLLYVANPFTFVFAFSQAWQVVSLTWQTLSCS
jgi:hypothetical protein